MIWSILNAFLWRASGAGKITKWYFPAFIVVYGFTLHAEWWRLGLALGASILVKAAPFTYIKDKYNIWWTLFLGLLYGLPMLALGHLNLWPLAWAFAAVLSNSSRTSPVYVWEFCECLAGITTIQ